MKEREKALERAERIVDYTLGSAEEYPNTCAAITDAILEAQAEEAERPTILEPETPYFYHREFTERAAYLRAQIGKS